MLWKIVVALAIALGLFIWAVYHGVKYGFERIEEDEHWYHD